MGWEEDSREGGRGSKKRLQGRRWNKKRLQGRRGSKIRLQGSEGNRRLQGRKEEEEKSSKKG